MAGRVVIRRVAFSLIIVLMFVVTACSQIANVPALQQTGGTWPRCISGCTANDVEINGVWLNVLAGAYTPGEVVTHNVSMNLYFHRQNTYCIVVVADLYEGGVLEQTDWVSSIIGYHGDGGNYTYPMGAVNWTYGKLFEMRNVLVMWDVNPPDGGTCPTHCGNYIKSKCFQPAGIIVTTPLVVDFEFNEVCFCDDTTFTDKTTGGAKPYTWYWDFADGDSSATQNATHHFDAAGSYTVTLNVTDSDSPPNIDSQSYNVTVNEKPTANAGGDTGFCAGGSVQLGGSATGGTSPYTYDWTGSESHPNTRNPTVSTAGTYTLNVTDGNGCSDTDDVTVSQYPGPTADAGGDTGFCAGGSVQLSGSATGGTSPYTYDWTGPESHPNTRNPTVSTVGTYTLNVTDGNGCSDTDDVTVSQYSSPTADAGGDTGFCAGGSVQLSGSATGGTSPYTYDWTGPESHPNTQNPTVSTAGTYTLNVTDDNGCSDTDDATVSQYPGPTADAGADTGSTAGSLTLIGGNQTASGGTPSYTYNWTPSTGLNATNIANPTASPAVNTTYTVTVTDSRGCTDSDDVTVTVTVTEGCCICGFVYRANTTQPLVDWEVILERHTSPWVEVGSATTDANGKYCFCGLGNGEYRVSEVVQAYWNQVSPLANEHLVTLPRDCCDPVIELFRDFDFENDQVDPLTVGWESSPVDKLAVLVPWIALLAVIVVGASLLVLRRRRA